MSFSLCPLMPRHPAAKAWPLIHRAECTPEKKSRKRQSSFRSHGYPHAKEVRPQVRANRPELPKLSFVSPILSAKKQYDCSFTFALMLFRTELGSARLAQQSQALTLGWQREEVKHFFASTKQRESGSSCLRSHLPSGLQVRVCKHRGKFQESRSYRQNLKSIQGGYTLILP